MQRSDRSHGCSPDIAPLLVLIYIFVTMTVNRTLGHSEVIIKFYAKLCTLLSYPPPQSLTGPYSPLAPHPRLCFQGYGHSPSLPAVTPD